MDHSGHGSQTDYKKNSLSLAGAVSMGTAVIIGAGIFALTGQIAELAGPLFPLAFLVAAVVSGFSAYSYIKLSNALPSSGGIAMFLQKAYGKGAFAAGSALLMYFSMVINQSLVSRTFSTYTLQLFDIVNEGWLLQSLSVGLLLFAFLINISGNRLIGNFSIVMPVLKIGGITAFGILGLWFSGISFESYNVSPVDSNGLGGFLAAVALAILAYKGYTTITNSGSEIVDPHRNVGRAIIISILICVVVYFLVAVAVASNLTLPEIINSKNFALAEAARPFFGDFGLWFTVILAIIATVSGVIASAFAVSRMLAMLTDMKLVPHSHFGMPGTVHQHVLVYTIALAMFLAVFFDLSRIASLGAIFYLTMDIAIHWGVLRYLRKEIQANIFILLIAIAFDIIILGAFLIIKIQTDILVVYVSILAMITIFSAEKLYLKWHRGNQ
jgi:amino acid transporter